MQSTHTVLVPLFGCVIGADGTLAHEGGCPRTPTSDYNTVCSRRIWFKPIWLRFLWSVSLHKNDPNPRHCGICVRRLWEKVARIPLLNLFFFGVGLQYTMYEVTLRKIPWVGDHPYEYTRCIAYNIYRKQTTTNPTEIDFNPSFANTLIPSYAATAKCTYRTEAPER